MANIYGANYSETINHFDGVTNSADVILGYGGDDGIWGLGGDDRIKGGGGADTIYGGEGTDTADYSDSDEAVAVFLLTGQGFGGTAEGDQLYSIENLNGSSHADWLIGNDETNILIGLGQDDTLEGRGGDDELYGDQGDDSLKGGGGHDVLNGGPGADMLDGGPGIDTADYSDSAAGVHILLSRGAGFGGDAVGDQFNSIENLNGSAYADELTATNGTNVLKGRDGNDTLRGLDGFDTLHGGRGDDILYGGEAGDVFVFDTALNVATNVDAIMDFNPANDFISIDDKIFSNLATGPGHVLIGQEFCVDATAQQADDRIIYDIGTGAISYDSDGTGAAAQVQFASVTPGTVLDNGNFLVF